MNNLLKLKLLLEGIKQGLPHVSSMTYGQAKGMMANKHVEMKNSTEKTDGLPFAMGHDHEGFFTQNSVSGKERMRSPEHYHERAIRRGKEMGKEPNTGAAKSYGNMHAILHANKHLQGYLKDAAKKNGGEAHIKGEMFYRPFSRESDTHKGERKFIGTSYSTHHMGEKGKFVMHTKMPENASHDVKHVTSLGDKHINIDHDKTEFASPHSKVDISKEHHEFKSLNHDLLSSRKTKANASAKEAETTKMSNIMGRVSKKVDAHVKTMGMKNRWGSGTEGIVVHPPHESSSQPRFKVTSDAFRKFHAGPESDGFKEKMAKGIKESDDTLLEGGNVKVDGVSADHIEAKERPSVQKAIHSTLSSISNSFKKAHGSHLYGENNKALKSGNAFSGSTSQFMDKGISHEEYAKHKPKTGDIDTQIPHEHLGALTDHLKSLKGPQGSHSVVGVKRHGSEVSALLKHHETGKVHQVDFEGVRYQKNGPHPDEKFLHSSDWGDTQKGIKGVHHKLLLNAAGTTEHKFAIQGLKSRSDDKQAAVTSAKGVAHALFGKTADHSKIHSFTGVSELISKHMSPSKQREVHKKFKDDVLKRKNLDSTAAIAHLAKSLKPLKESAECLTEAEEHHATVVPMVGFSPISHMGHAHDLGGTLKKLGGSKHIGISKKADSFDPSERQHILKTQMSSAGSGTARVHVVSGAGETIRKGYDSIAHKKGKKVLNIVLGHDRADMAHKLKKSLGEGKIKEMGNHRFDEVRIHHPEDSNRSHGLSGTKMRQAAHDGDLTTFKKHIGAGFSHDESKQLMTRIKKGINDGSVKLKR